MNNHLFERLSAEFFGTALLLAIVTGSGIMGESLSAGNQAIALLGNSIATGAGLFVLISLLGPISGAHFNPVVSMMFWQSNKLSLPQLMQYCCAQFSGAIVGVWLSHLMFSLPIIEISTKPRASLGAWVSEFISTLVLLSVIKIGLKNSPEKLPLLIAMIVTAGYWFTSSTFFANPAVTMARSLTHTFVGISPNDLSGFVLAQILALIIFVIFNRQAGAEV